MEKPVFPLGNKEIRIGMLGMTEGNAHPFSWSAMINSYDHEEMVKWTAKDYPTIPAYLGKQPADTFGIPGVKVTHICFTGYAEREMAENCARATFIPNVVDKPEDMIGQVDAIICATDIGAEHVERCRPFIEAGLPIFIDKPLADNEEDLRTIVKWHDQGAHIMSGSSLRYKKETEIYYDHHYEFGKFRYIISPMAKKWETYGMHAIEAFFHLVGCGFEWVENLGTYERPFVNLYHKDGCHVTIPMNTPAPGLWLCGEHTSKNVASGDSFYSFKKQLDVFVDFLRTGEYPFPFEETIECTKILVAGIRSREEGGRRVFLSEIHER